MLNSNNKNDNNTNIKIEITKKLADLSRDELESIHEKVYRDIEEKQMQRQLKILANYAKLYLEPPNNDC